MKNMTITALIVYFLAGISLASLSEAKENEQSFPTTVRKVATEIGHGTRNITREIGHGTRDVFKTIGHGTRDITREIGHASRDTVKKLVR